MDFNIKNENGKTLAEYVLNQGDQVDKQTLGVVLHNNIKGAVKASSGSQDLAIDYDLTGLKSLNDYFGDKVNKETLLKTFYSIAETVKEGRKYLVEQSAFLLDVEQSYVDEASGEARLIVVPLLGGVSDGQTWNFFKSILFTAPLDPDEDNEYVGKLMAMLNPNLYSLDKFTASLEEMLNIKKEDEKEDWDEILAKEVAADKVELEAIKKEEADFKSVVEARIAEEKEKLAKVKAEGEAALEEAKAKYAAAPSDAADSAEGAADEIKSEVEDVADTAANAVENAVDTASDVADNTADAAVETAENAVNDAKDTAESVAENAAGAASDTVESAADAVKETAKNVVDTAENTVETAVDEAKATADELKDSATDAVQSAADEAADKVDEAQDAVTDTFSNGEGNFINDSVPPIAPVEEAASNVEDEEAALAASLLQSAVGDEDPGYVDNIPEAPASEGEQTGAYLKTSEGKYYVGEGPYYIGSKEGEVDFLINAPAVSEKHAYIIKKGNEYFIVDNNSRTGTYMNGAELFSGEEEYIPHGARLRIGEQDFEFRHRD